MRYDEGVAYKHKESGLVSNFQFIFSLYFIHMSFFTHILVAPTISLSWAPGMCIFQTRAMPVVQSCVTARLA